MATFLWDDIVFGPIHSRRVGRSLGINLLPLRAKVCTFDCVYCECGGLRKDADSLALPTLEQVMAAIDGKTATLAEQGQGIDSISFTGNGEPTIHPDFPAIIDHILAARDRYFPQAVVSVFTNATRLDRPEVVAALKKVDNPILKIDCALDNMAAVMNRPKGAYSVARVVENMKAFEGNFVLQTMLVKGDVVDNTTPEALAAWYDVVRQLRPREIMLYSVARDTPVEGILKVDADSLRAAAAPLLEEGFNIQINA
ncbi:MAG: radical SAM protein [Bacteroidales bacterium]|nr:radical SAM protein [Bacteroidales bacterium]